MNSSNEELIGIGAQMIWTLRAENEALRSALATLVARGCLQEAGYDGEFWQCRFCDELTDGDAVHHAASCPWPEIAAKASQG